MPKPENKFSVKKTVRYLAAVLFLAAFLILPVAVLAQADELAQVGQAAGIQSASLLALIGRIISIVLASLGVIAVGLMIYAGFVWTTAGGSADKVAKAKKIMINAGIGLVIIVSSYAIASFIVGRLEGAVQAPVGGGTTAGQGGGGLSGLPRCTCPQGEAPYICSISPASGPAGKYVTVWGCRFGSYEPGKSKVRFGEADSSVASCGENPSWKDTKIVTIVPEGLVEGSSYQIIVANSQGLESSNAKPFRITAGDPGPGIACVIPDIGKQGQAIDIFGDRFGDSQGESRVDFGKTPAQAASSWAAKKISLSVPDGAIGGDIKVTVAEIESNGYPFSVKCGLADDCRSDTYCCDGFCDTKICTNIDGSCAGGKSCPSGYSCCPDEVCRRNCNVDGSCAGGENCPSGYNCCEDETCRISCQGDVILCNYNGVKDAGETGVDCGGGGCALCGGLGTSCYSSPGTCGSDNMCQLSTGQCKGEEDQCRCCCRDDAGCPNGLICDQTQACGGSVHGLCCGCASADQCGNNEICAGGCCHTCQGETDNTACKGGSCCAGLCCHGDCQDGICVPYCGNGKVDPGEECDGGDLSGQACDALGFASGVLACSYDCKFDTRECASPESGKLGDICRNSNAGGCTTGKADCAAGGPSLDCVQNNQSAPCACCCRPAQGLISDSCSANAPAGCNMVCNANKPCGSSGQKGLCCGCDRDECCNGGIGQICADNCCHPFPAPDNLVITGANVNQIGIKWRDNSDYETGFEIYRSTDQKSWGKIGDTNADVTVYIDTNDANGEEPGNFNKDQTYYYKVRAKR